ncbi:MAG TPA: hypothetical protein PKA00_23100 [Saprospiraceae bacterium]|nr:hypothetical protein [Saprospiraceae bacterium]HMQ85816.1 hypothetical protein [Saprospiraceae bacterium]
MPYYAAARQLRIFWKSQAIHGLPARGLSAFGSGREALFSLCQSIKPDGVGSVLLPVWVPEGVYQPFHLAGWKITFYNITHTGSPDWSDVQVLLAQQHYQLAVIIHYFGLPHSTQPFLELLPANTLLLEDWSHSFPHPGWPIPQAGHWALFSPNKLIGTTDGAWLIGSEQLPVPAARFLERGPYLFWRVVHLLASRCLQDRLPIASFWLWLQGGAYARSYRLLLQQTASPRAMSGLGCWLIRHSRPQQEAHIRIQQAEYYRQYLSNPHIRPIQADAAIHHPMVGYSVWVEDRLAFSQYLASKGIFGIQLSEAWWFAPVDDPRFTSARALFDHHYLLPLHPAISRQGLAHVVACVNAYGLNG